MTAVRPLPTVIGPTENALRALLTTTLATTSIDGYPAWVTLNMASKADVGGASDDSWRAAVADALKVPVGVVDGVVAQLRTVGLLADNGTLTERGAAELATAWTAVAAATSGLVAGISEADQETTRQVLDQIRRNAENALSA